jgi:hypothetical protein
MISNDEIVIHHPQLEEDNYPANDEHYLSSLESAGSLAGPKPDHTIGTLESLYLLLDQARITKENAIQVEMDVESIIHMVVGTSTLDHDSLASFLVNNPTLATPAREKRMEGLTPDDVRALQSSPKGFLTPTDMGSEGIAYRNAADKLGI